MTYHVLQYNSDRSHFLLFPQLVHLVQVHDMLEIWMDDDNDAIVRIVADKSYQHLKQ